MQGTCKTQIHHTVRIYMKCQHYLAQETGHHVSLHLPHPQRQVEGLWVYIEVTLLGPHKAFFITTSHTHTDQFYCSSTTS